jgi:hypothetical protein
MSDKSKQTLSETGMSGLQPIPAETVPQHPFMAPNNYSNVHCDAYQTDTYTCPGPLGTFGTNNLKAKLYSISHSPEICITVTIDSQGRLITIGNWVENSTAQHELLLLDPETLKILASYKLPSGGITANSVGSGAYFYLDQDNRAVVAQADGNICVYAVLVQSSGPYFKKLITYTTSLPSTASIQSAMPDWSGRIWFATDGGIVGVFDNGQTKSPYTIQLTSTDEEDYGENEAIANSFAVDETGGVFIASDHAMYRFDYDSSAENPIVQTWKCSYDRGSYQKPGQKSQGTGTTPTLLNVGDTQFVSITDNADPQMNVLVYRREKDFEGTREVWKQAVFTINKSDTENSLIGFAGAYIVENNFGYLAPFGTTLKHQTTPGMTLVNFSGSTTVNAWDNETLSVPSLVSKASLPDGVVYTYSVEVTDNIPYWYFTAVDCLSGEAIYKLQTGTGADYDNYYSGIVIHPTLGTAYVPVEGGMVKISNG